MGGDWEKAGVRERKRNVIGSAVHSMERCDEFKTSSTSAFVFIKNRTHEPTHPHTICDVRSRGMID